MFLGNALHSVAVKVFKHPSVVDWSARDVVFIFMVLIIDFLHLHLYASHVVIFLLCTYM